jgi:hypothetical protein
VAISVAMFGMTVGAIIVYLLPALFTAERARPHLATSSLLFAVAVVLSFLTYLTIPFTPGLSVIGLYVVVLTYVVIAIPFIFSGIGVCIALTKFPRQVSTLYAADLAGAALGCILLLYVLRIMDAPTAVFLVAAFGAVAAVLFALDARRPRLLTLATVASVLLIAFVWINARRAGEQRPLVGITWVNGAREQPPTYEKWNSFSRIRVFGDPETDKIMPIVIDTIAATYMSRFDGTDLTPPQIQIMKDDIFNIAHKVRPNARVLVIGTGGGKDVLSALVANAREVVGVEMNEDILRIVNEKYGEYTGHLDRHPKVRFVNDEARSYVTRSRESFDIIQISLIDTWAATASGAFVLSENSLYTVEAWKTFLGHLTTTGVLTVTRWYNDTRPGEIYRTAALASEALMALGVKEPRGHILIARQMNVSISDGVGTILVSRAPFTEADLLTLAAHCAQWGYEIVLKPRPDPGKDYDKVLATIADGRGAERIYRRYPVNVAPPTDDSPFFFNMLRLRDILRPHRWEQGIVSFNMKAVVLLGILLVTVFGLTLLCIIVPLVLTTRRETLRGSSLFFLFFASIGFGFMLVEISQMQRLIVFLGHPTYSLSVVLFSLLISSGIGSLLTGGIDDARLGRSGLVRLLLLLCMLVLFGILTPQAIQTFQASTTPVRILAAVAILMPIGLFMGMAFPIGMRLALQKSPALTPWLWGINGATSVCASVLAIAIALSTGISHSFWTGCVCYGVAFLSYALAVARHAPAQAPVPADTEKVSAAI